MYPFTLRDWLTHLVFVAQGFNHRVSASLNAVVKSALAKMGQDNRVDDIGRNCIGQLTFKTVTHFYAHLALLLRDDQQGAIVFTFLTDTPGATQLIAKILDFYTLQIRNSNHNDLVT